jgi:hypothetical protein
MKLFPSLGGRARRWAAMTAVGSTLVALPTTAVAAPGQVEDVPFASSPAPSAAQSNPTGNVPPPNGTELFSIRDAQSPGIQTQWKFIVGGKVVTTTTQSGFPGGQVPAEINLLRQTTLRVTDFMCQRRSFCGRIGGKTTWAGAFTIVSRAEHSRFAAETGQAKVIRIQPGDAGAEDIVAHELGHLMDKGTYAASVRDSAQDMQGDEVEEALADMFAYDYDHDDAEIGENRIGRDGRGFRDWQTPGSIQGDHDKNDLTPRIPYPATMAQYRCDARDEHFNGTILSHGYWLFDNRVGHDVAGAVLHRVPARLSARPRYIEVMRAFKDAALERFGATASQAAVDAFKNGAGIGLQDPTGC